MAGSGFFSTSPKTILVVTAFIFLGLYFIWVILPDIEEETPRVLLSPDERAWLDANPEKLTLFYNTDFPPVEFAAEDGSFNGLGADVISEVEEILEIEFLMTPCEDWNRHLQALADGECAVAPTIVRTTERESYAYFTVPYASAPVVIVTTRSTNEDLTLDDLEGLRVAVVSGFATEDYLEQVAGDRLSIAPMWNVPTALIALSFGEVDAFVGNLAVSSYFAETEGLSNLRVAGVTDYYFQWSIGVSRKYPLLFSSIQKALAGIPRSHLDEMYSSWISMGNRSNQGFLRKVYLMALLAAVLLILLGGITLYLKHRLNDKVSTLAKTQKQLLEKTVRLQHAEKMEALGNLAGGIAHDFNNILQVISGHAQLILTKDNVDTEERRSLENIVGAGRRAATLIGQLMAFSRQVEFSKVPVDINREVENAVEVLRQTIPKMVDIKVDLQQGLPPVFADPVHLEQVVFNLAGNSVDAMKGRGELYITTEEVFFEGSFCRETGVEMKGSYVILTVTDTGAGIPPEVQRNMYNPFYTTKEAGRGTGLGLASVYGIVKSLNGCIRCSSSIGQGTTFLILLPRAELPPGESDGTDSQLKPAHGSGERILVVDDEPDIRDQSYEYLTRLGYRVSCAESGEEALEMNLAAKADLILLDLNMPGIGGYKCLKELKNRDPLQKVLIVSGHSEFDVNLSDLMKDSSGFLRKPYRLDSLAERIREILTDTPDVNAGGSAGK